MYANVCKQVNPYMNVTTDLLPSECYGAHNCIQYQHCPILGNFYNNNMILVLLRHTERTNKDLTLMHRQVKEHGWVLVSKSLTHPSTPPRVGEVI